MIHWLDYLYAGRGHVLVSPLTLTLFVGIDVCSQVTQPKIGTKNVVILSNSFSEC